MRLCARAFGYIVVVAIALLMADSGLAQDAPKYPVESMSVSVPEGSRGEFLAALTRFAQLNNLTIDTKAIAPNGIEYRAILLNPDVEIVAANPFEPTDFLITFYYGASGSKSDDYIRMVRSAFADMLNSLAGVTIANHP